MRALDLFCGAGGAGAGLARAGFTVKGVDFRPQPGYPFEFEERDVCDIEPWELLGYDFIWASPPCQKHTAMRTMHNAKAHLDLIPPTRALLEAAGVPYAIENVVGAPLLHPVMLCSSTLAPEGSPMELQRERLVEASFPVPPLPCAHRLPCLGLYGGHVRDRRRREGSKNRGREDPPLALAQRLMGVDWMTLGDMCQAIPPAYSEHVARAWLAQR